MRPTRSGAAYSRLRFVRNDRQEHIGRTASMAFAMLQHMEASFRKTEVDLLEQAGFDARRRD